MEKWIKIYTMLKGKSYFHINLTEYRDQNVY